MVVMMDHLHHLQPVEPQDIHILGVTGGTTATQTNLAAGTYTVTVTDANGCTDEETFTLTEPTNFGCIWHRYEPKLFRF